MAKELSELAQEMGLNLGVNAIGNSKFFKFKKSELWKNLFEVLMERANRVDLKMTFNQFMNRITGSSCLQQQEFDMSHE